MFEDVLKCGLRPSSDNAVVVNCSKDFLAVAKSCLSQSSFDCKSIVVNLNRDNLATINNYLKNFNYNGFQTGCIINDYINSIILMKLMEDFEFDKAALGTTKEELVKYLNSFNPSDGKFPAQYSSEGSATSYEIQKVAKDYGKFDLSFILDNVSNRLVYQAINGHLGSRTPYLVKVFTSNDSLLSNIDLNDNLVQRVHDYQLIDSCKIDLSKLDENIMGE